MAGRPPLERIVVLLDDYRILVGWTGNNQVQVEVMDQEVGYPDGFSAMYLPPAIAREIGELLIKACDRPPAGLD